MTQTDKPNHTPGPWDPLPEGYWVELRKYRPTESGYYYLMSSEDPNRAYSGGTVDQMSGRFKPENVAKRFGPRAKANAEKRARERRERAERAACEGLSTEALEAGVVAELLTACEKTMAIALEIGERAVKVSRTSHGKFSSATVKDDSSRYIRAVKAAIAKAKGG